MLRAKRSSPMTRHSIAVTSLLALGLGLSACSSGTDAPETGASSTTVAQSIAPAPIESGPPASAEPVSDKVLTIKGLGELAIGKAIPAGGSWAERGAQASDTCRTVTSPDYPGVYAIMTDGKVRRITVGQRSDVKLIEGIGIGSAESDVAKWFAGFRAEPHKYVEAPAKYLTGPNASTGDLALRFEIGRDGKVSLMHAGTMPALGYVEGCS